MACSYTTLMLPLKSKTMINPLHQIGKYRFSILFVSSLFFSTFLPAQTFPTDTIPTIFKEFQRDSILELIITTDTKQLIKKKFDENWQPVSLDFATVDQQQKTYDAKIRTRGNIRKKICYYPPLKLKFKKEWLNENGLDSNFNDLKLVIGCKKGSYYSKLVLKEYLTYQLYAALTDFSFQTQLVSVKMIDSKGEQEMVETIGFLIENQDEMANRFNGRCTKPKVMRSKSVDIKQWAFLSLFEYMIGNTDWAMPNSHNVRYIVTRTSNKVIPIAYDFDYSGLVDAPYAAHRESIDLKEITTRYFLGSCKIRDHFEQQIPLFLENKDTLFRMVNEFDMLPAKDRKGMIKYLNEFYDLITKPKSFKRYIIDKCIDH